MRQRIVAVAQTLFLRYGYSRVVVDDIVRELAISKKTIYNHFAGKKDILLACIEQFALDYQAGAKAILTNTDLPLRQKVMAYLRLVGESFSNINQEFWTDLKHSEPDAWAKVNAFKREIMLQNLSVLMDEGVRAGYLRNDSSRYIAMLIYIATMPQLDDLDYLNQFPAEIRNALPHDPIERTDQVANVLLQGLLTPKFYNEQFFDEVDTKEKR